MRWILAALLSLAVNVFLVVILVGASQNGYNPFGTLKSLDVATISLSAASVAVTCVGIVIAIVGAFGYGQIKTQAVETAVAESKEIAAAKAAEVASAVAARTVTEYIATINVGNNADVSQQIADAVVKDKNGE